MKLLVLGYNRHLFFLLFVGHIQLRKFHKNGQSGLCPLPS